MKRKRRGIEIRIYGKDTRRESNKMNTTKKKIRLQQKRQQKQQQQSATTITRKHHTTEATVTPMMAKNIYICISLNSAVCL